MTDDLIEAVARAMERELGVSFLSHSSYRDIARAALAAIEASGTHVVVPVEPTSQMLGDADSAIPRFEAEPSGIRLAGEDGVNDAWKAMLAARPKVQQ